MLSNHLTLCSPLLLLPSIFPSIRVFSNESALHIRWPKYWSLSFNISPSNEHPGLISFRVDWLDLPAVQGTLKSLLQHHSSKASILWCSAFFIVQLSHPYMTTGKTIALTRWTFVDKVMPLLFNMLSRLVITLLPRNKCLLISWFQSPSAVILKPPKIKSATVSPSICHEVMGPDAMILVLISITQRNQQEAPGWGGKALREFRWLGTGEQAPQNAQLCSWPALGWRCYLYPRKSPEQGTCVVQPWILSNKPQAETKVMKTIGRETFVTEVRSVLIS